MSAPDIYFVAVGPACFGARVPQRFFMVQRPILNYAIRKARSGSCSSFVPMLSMMPAQDVLSMCDLMVKSGLIGYGDESSLATFR